MVPWSWSLTVLLLLPLVGAIGAALAPKKYTLEAAAFVSIIPVGWAVSTLIGFETFSGLQQYVDEIWIKELGIHYALGVDGLNVFLIALTTLAWAVAMFAVLNKPPTRPRMFVLLMGLAQTATLGAFLAQDLMLFVLFFDLLLIPFYFLIGMWGQGDRRAATTKFMIYTLAGSLLMFAAAIGLGIAAQHDTGTLSFAFVDLLQARIGDQTQIWIFGGFAIALLIKMPAVPLHGWMPDAYRAAPLPVLIVLSAVVAKLGAYGFLKVVLPLLPHAVTAHQTTYLVLALVSILYGSLMAFRQDDTRLVVGYSSVAQLGFVALGIWSLDAKGVEGAVMQMVNHGLVVIALFLIVGMLHERSGSDLLSRMGGLAQKAPVLATLFLITSLATLAMPGSPNFVGELYILFGAFESSFVFGVVATSGVALAAFYALRLFQRSMHNRATASADSREITGDELTLLLPVIAVLLALAVYPQLMAEKIEPATEPALVGVVTERETERKRGLELRERDRKSERESSRATRAASRAGATE